MVNSGIGLVPNDMYWYYREWDFMTSAIFWRAQRISLKYWRYQYWKYLDIYEAFIINTSSGWICYIKINEAEMHSTNTKFQ